MAIKHRARTHQKLDSVSLENNRAASIPMFLMFYFEGQIWLQGKQQDSRGREKESGKQKMDGLQIRSVPATRRGPSFIQTAA